MGSRLRGGVVIVLACMLGLTGCAPISTPTPTPSRASPSATPAVIPGIKYDFGSAAAISSAPSTMSVKHGSAYLDVTANGQPQVVGSCKVSLYAPILGADQRVTVANQRAVSREVLTGYLQQAGETATITVGTLPTNEISDHTLQRLHTLTATYVNGSTVTTVHVRAFTNGRVIVYQQQCPKRAILDPTTTIRINTA